VAQFFKTDGQEVTIPDFSGCCSYCRAEGHMWIENSNPWNLTVNEYHVTDFQSPSSYFVYDSTASYHHVRDGVYKISHAGAPVTITRTSIGDEAYILSKQYLQIDLGKTRTVVGISTQGGFYSEADDELLDSFHGWVTTFALSYTTSGSLSGSYSYYRHEDGYVQVFTGNTDSMTHVENSLPSSIITRGLRFHPLGGGSVHGSVSQTLVRVGVIVCEEGNSCNFPRFNCEAGNWAAWGECVCSSIKCQQTRSRSIYRYNACGGAACPATEEIQECEVDEGAWVEIAIYAGGAAGALLLIIIIIACLVKRHHRKRNAVVFDKQSHKFGKQDNMSDSQTKIRDAEEGCDQDTGPADKEQPLSPRQIHMEQGPDQKSLPDEERLYQEELNRSINPTVPVMPVYREPSNFS